MKNEKQFLTSEDVKTCFTNAPQITFEITDACNLKCEYCGYGKFYADYDERKNQVLPIKYAENLIDYLSECWQSPINKSINANLYVSFYGGEPLLNMKFIKHIRDYLEKLKSPFRSFKYSMTTNALLLDKYMDYLVEKEFNLLISLDGNKHNTSYRVDSQGKSAYERIVNNVDKLRAKYPSFFQSNVNFNAVLHNRNSVEEIYYYFKSKYDKIPSIGDLNNVGIRKDKMEEFQKTYKNSTESLLNSENYTEIEKDMFLGAPTYNTATMFLLQNSNFSYHNYNELLYGKEKLYQYLPSGTCTPFSRKIYVTVNGKLLPCERIGHQFALGKLDDGKIEIDFEAIAKRYNKYYNKINNLCRKCHLKKSCTQCIFNLPSVDNKNIRCHGFMNEKTYKIYENNQLLFFKSHPEAYAKIMNEVNIK